MIGFRRTIILATASEARRRLVADAGISFSPCAVEIDESPLPGEEVGRYALRLAGAKARAVAAEEADALIVAVDTAVGLGGRIMGKPRDRADAEGMLKSLSGRTHEVTSAIALRDMRAGTMRAEVARTEVDFDELSDRAVEWYLDTGEWIGRAGAYAIQGRGVALIKAVRGCLTNVIGISIPLLMRMLGDVHGNGKVP